MYARLQGTYLFVTEYGNRYNALITFSFLVELLLIAQSIFGSSANMYYHWITTKPLILKTL